MQIFVALAASGSFVPRQGAGAPIITNSEGSIAAGGAKILTFLDSLKSNSQSLANVRNLSGNAMIYTCYYQTTRHFTNKAHISLDKNMSTTSMTSRILNVLTYFTRNIDPIIALPYLSQKTGWKCFRAQ